MTLVLFLYLAMKQEFGDMELMTNMIMFNKGLYDTSLGYIDLPQTMP